MARVSNTNAVRRDHIETAQTALIALLASVEEVILRNQQAIRRTPLVEEVLTPAVHTLAGMRAEIRAAQRELAQAWSEGQKSRWTEDK